MKYKLEYIVKSTADVIIDLSQKGIVCDETKTILMPKKLRWV